MPCSKAVAHDTSAATVRIIDDETLRMVPDISGTDIVGRRVKAAGRHGFERQRAWYGVTSVKRVMVR